MAKLDFKEIPPADKASGQQDAFELFARDTLVVLGFTILLHPSRGADGGKDLIAEECRVGPLSQTKIKWLVSCKHFAHSGNSVKPDDERNVLERVEAAQCNGFLGFYSTLPSTGLTNLIGKAKNIEVCLLDHERIEQQLLDSKGHEVIERYFPLSHRKFKPQPAKLYSPGQPICCEDCGKDLFEPPSGIWVLWHIQDKNKYSRCVDMHFTCKGDCDRRVEQGIRMRHSAMGFLYDGWDDIPDMLLPTVFISKVMALINGLAKGDRYEPEAINKMKHLLLTVFPHVSRNLTTDEEETLNRLQQIPSYLGGMGYDG